ALMPTRLGARLERYANSDLYTPWARGIGGPATAVGTPGGELQEVVRRERRYRRAPVRVIEDVERLEAERRIEPLLESELLELREVLVPSPLTAELVAERSAKTILPGTSRLREEALVVVGVGSARTHFADWFRIATDVDHD